MEHILEYFPDKLKNILNSEISDKYEFLEEIRIRVQKPIILKFNYFEKTVRYFVNTEEILSILQLVCENSIYSYQNEIAEGFVTVRGGHRIGITGSCVIQNKKVININYINSLNFRISRQILDCSEQILKYVLNFNENTVFNTLIVSPPGFRKNYYFKRFS